MNSRHPQRPISRTVEDAWGREIEIRFPTYKTLVDDFIEAGRIQSAEDLVDPSSHHLLGDLFLAWVRYGQHSCQFARRLAKHHPREGWQVVVLSEVSEALPGLLNSVLSSAPDTVEACVLLFPGVAAPEHAVGMINALCAHESWWWEDLSEDCGDRLLVGLRWEIADGGQESWVLGFAAFESMPFTRRIENASFTALILRHCWPPSNRHPVFGKKGNEVHLANMPLDESEDTVQHLCQRTRWLRKELLGEEDDLAKAKVTFCFPPMLRELLCHPGRYNP